MTVVEHGTINHTFMTVCKMFQVLIVGRDDSISLLLAEFIEYCLCDGSSDTRFCTGTKLIYQYDGVAIGGFHHIFHVQEVG